MKAYPVQDLYLFLICSSIVEMQAKVLLLKAAVVFIGRLVRKDLKNLPAFIESFWVI